MNSKGAMQAKTFTCHFDGADLSFGKDSNHLLVRYAVPKPPYVQQFIAVLDSHGDVKVQSHLLEADGSYHEVKEQAAKDVRLTKPFYDLFALFEECDAAVGYQGKLSRYNVSSLVSALQTLDEQLPEPVTLKHAPVPMGTRLVSSTQENRDHLEMDKDYNGVINIHYTTNLPFRRQQIHLAIRPSDHVTADFYKLTRNDARTQTKKCSQRIPGEYAKYEQWFKRLYDNDMEKGLGGMLERQDIVQLCNEVDYCVGRMPEVRIGSVVR